MVENEGEKREESSLTNRVRNPFMSTWKYRLLTAAMIVAPLPAAAAAQETPAVEIVVDHSDAASTAVAEAALADSKAMMQTEMAEAVALIEQMFDTSDLPPVEPARLALPHQTTAAPLPSRHPPPDTHTHSATLAKPTC